MPDGCILGPFLLIADVSVDVDVDGCYIVSLGCLGYFDSYGVVCLHFGHDFSCFVFGNCSCSFSFVFIVNVIGDINVDILDILVIMVLSILILQGHSYCA